MASAEEFLPALAEVDFNWIRQVQNVWTLKNDVPQIHAWVRRKFQRHLKKLQKTKNLEALPGLVIIGNPGAGKTHLLANFSQKTMEEGGFFLNVDMTGVNSFYDTVVEHFINSLSARDKNGRSQALRLVYNILETTRDPSKPLPSNFDTWFPNTHEKKLIERAGLVIGRLHAINEHQAIASRFGDLIRAVFLFCSGRPELANYGRLWLQGLGDSEDCFLKALNFSGPRANPIVVIQGLTWLMSLNGGFSVLALDQLDSIIKIHSTVLTGAKGDLNRDNFLAADRILTEVSSGLGTLINITYKSTTVLSLLPESLSALNQFGLSTSMQRYEASQVLTPVVRAEDIEALVTVRLAPAYFACNLTPPYPSWPFPPDIFEKAAGLLNPRQILSRCHEHLEKCLDRGEAFECLSLTNRAVKTQVPRKDSPARLFDSYCQNVDPSIYKPVLAEDNLWPQTMEILAHCLCLETDFSPEEDELQVCQNYLTKSWPQLHATVAHIYHRKPSGPDRYLSIRALLQDNANSFRARLNGAMTTSGIDQKLSSRRLVIIRFDSYPSGTQTQKEINIFTEKGGFKITPADEDLKRIGGLAAAFCDRPPDFEAWLKEEKPTSKIECFKEQFSWLTASDKDIS
ncbi:MAG: hypothetical protein LBP22_07785 [Deltaproteobacteria bacterium]|jgi:hypothetical protein|nr:hypothetical protein [Deltaproteobacteria bacterium]